jgi:hypothetical protein
MSHSCPICYELYGNSVNDLHCPRVLPCGHTLCMGCIVNMSKTHHHECPTCKRKFELINTIVNFNSFDSESQSTPATDEVLKLFRQEKSTKSRPSKNAYTFKGMFGYTNVNEYLKDFPTERRIQCDAIRAFMHSEYGMV